MVTFDIDANGILNVSAKDRGTGKEQKITITGNSGLSKAEIDKMQRDAEQHAEEDKRKREEIEARNEADSVVYRSEKMLRENADKISESDRNRIQEAVNAVKEALKGQDASTTKSAADRLNEIWQSVSAELYKAAGERAGTQGAQGGPQGQAGPRGTRPESGERKEDDVVDAEIVDEQRH